jgi:hypothetical protein
MFWRERGCGEDFLKGGPAWSTWRCLPGLGTMTKRWSLCPMKEKWKAPGQFKLTLHPRPRKKKTAILVKKPAKIFLIGPQATYYHPYDLIGCRQ